MIYKIHNNSILNQRLKCKQVGSKWISTLSILEVMKVIAEYYD